MTQEDINDLMWDNMPDWQKEQINASKNSTEAYQLGYKAGIEEEREACAVTCESCFIQTDYEMYVYARDICADAIRNRNKEE